MKKEYQIKVELTNEDIKEILADHIAKVTGETVSPSDVKLKARMHYGQMDRGPGLPDTAGATISVTKRMGA